MLEKQEGIIWMDGELIDWDKAKIHVLTHTLHYGSGVFEGARAYEGRIFEMTRHHERLHASARMMGFKIPYSPAQLDTAAVTVLRENGLKDAYVRPIAWHGAEALGVSTNPNKVRVAIAAWKWDTYYANASISLTWSEWVRPAPTMSLVHAKANGQYITGMVSLNKAHRDGFNDAIMLDYRGYVAECTSSNIFYVKGGTLFTPIADCFLNGITRQTVIALAAANDIPCRETHALPDDLLNADEVFVTGSAAEIQAVGKIGAKKFGEGPVTHHIASLYKDATRRGHA